MEKLFVKTRLGRIAVYRKASASRAVPIIFLHGVYLDHTLWTGQVDAIDDRTVLTLDMPWHGESREGVPAKWTLEDCAGMLLEALDALEVPKVVAIGHSWGSMTILRAAARHPERFAAVGLCNMPFAAASGKEKLTFHLQHLALPFRDFYAKQAGKALFGKVSLQENPDLLARLQSTMEKLSNHQVRQTDQFVILDAADASSLIATLPVRTLALKGEEDYVPSPPGIETEIVPGGHISPLEVPERVTAFTRSVLAGAVSAFP